MMFLKIPGIKRVFTEFKKSSKCHRGNAYIEYILPLALIGLVILPVTQGNLLQAFQKLLYSTTNGKLNGQTLQVPAMGSTVTSSINSNSPITTVNLQSLVKTKSIGLPQTTLPTLAFSNGTIAVDTSGGLGGNDVLAAAYKIDELLAALKQDNQPQQLIYQVQDLAWAAHSSADLMTGMQSGMYCYKGGCQTHYTLGTLYQDLQGLQKSSVDLTASNPTGGGSLSNVNYRYELLQQYLAKNPGALNAYPNAFQIINQAVGQIRGIIQGISYTETTADITNSDGTVSKNVPTYIFSAVNSAQNALGDSEVHQNGNTVCQQGGDASCMVTVKP